MAASRLHAQRAAQPQLKLRSAFDYPSHPHTLASTLRLQLSSIMLLQEN